MVSLPDVNIDHIKPVVCGGTNDPANLQVVHKRCNSSKCARTQFPRVNVTMKPEAFKAWRTSMNATQREVADALGVNYRLVSEWERGKSPIWGHHALRIHHLKHA
jgi:DNA-binding transcriptional regulator YiaG